MLKNAHEYTQTPRLVERSTQDDGALTEVFEVAPGELVVVESWSVEEVTVPARPSARRP